MVEMGGRCIKYIHTTLTFKRISELDVVVVMVEMFFPKSIENKEKRFDPLYQTHTTRFPSPEV